MIIHDIYEIIENCDYYTKYSDLGYCSCRDCSYFRDGEDNHTTYDSRGRCLVTEIFGAPPYYWNLESIDELYKKG